MDDHNCEDYGHKCWNWGWHAAPIDAEPMFEVVGELVYDEEQDDFYPPTYGLGGDLELPSYGS